MIIEFESSCRGRETEEGVIGNEEVSGDGDVSCGGFSEIEEGSIRSGDVSSENGEIGADGSRGLGDERAGGTEFILGVEDAARGSPEDLEGGAGMDGGGCPGRQNRQCQSLCHRRSSWWWHSR
ncbi:MAG: hypothetical protein Greene101449_268 [Candidatus Peregrinibacteria bacterium Greene1014_49]|nr:MAG: hypothetical protein Greene101449_268 [Candidatus Peregrinibacteria bacterium Greene1014_49]